MRRRQDMYKDSVIRVGYWQNKVNSVLFPRTAHLPDVTKLAEEEPPYDEATLTQIVAYLDSPKHERVQFRGWSNCRICDCTNGTEDVSDGRYIWPSGLSHYVTEHNVRLPEDFVDYILKAGRW